MKYLKLFEDISYYDAVNSDDLPISKATPITPTKIEDEAKRYSELVTGDEDSDIILAFIAGAHWMKNKMK